VTNPISSNGSPYVSRPLITSCELQSLVTLLNHKFSVYESYGLEIFLKGNFVGCAAVET